MRRLRLSLENTQGLAVQGHEKVGSIWGMIKTVHMNRVGRSGYRRLGNLESRMVWTASLTTIRDLNLMTRFVRTAGGRS